MSVITTFAKVYHLILTVFQLSVLAHESCDTFSQSMTRNVYYKRRFRSRVVESQPINGPLECHVKCMDKCDCLSYNICNGGTLCELNAEKKESNFSSFETSDDCDHHEVLFNRKVSFSIILPDNCSFKVPGDLLVMQEKTIYFPLYLIDLSVLNLLYVCVRQEETKIYLY